MNKFFKTGVCLIGYGSVWMIILNTILLSITIDFIENLLLDLSNLLIFNTSKVGFQ
jgi:hypothetical protein